MKRISSKQLSFSIAQLMPHIIQGVHLRFLVKNAVTQTQFLVLIAIHSRGRCPMTLLAKNLHVSLPTISGIVDRLVKSGQVKRLSDQQDRRQVLIELSPKGKAMIAQFQQAISTRWEEILEILDPQDRKDFDRIIKKLNSGFLKGRL